MRSNAGAGAAALPRAGVRLSRAGGEELQGDPETQNSHYYALVADDGGVAGESAANEGVAAASAVGVADWYSFKKVSDARELLTTEDAEALMAARNKKSYQRWMLKNEGIKAALEDGEGAGAGGGGGGAADAADAAMGFGGAAAVKQGKTNREVLDELNEAGEGEGEGEDKGEAWEHEDAATDDDEAAAAGSEDEEEPEEKDPLRRKKAKAEAAEDGEGNELNVAGQMFATLLARAEQDEDGSGSDSEDDSDEEPFVDPDEDPDAGGLFDRMAKKAAGDEGGGAGGSGGTKRGVRRPRVRARAGRWRGVRSLARASARARSLARRPSLTRARSRDARRPAPAVLAACSCLSPHTCARSAPTTPTRATTSSG